MKTEASDVNSTKRETTTYSKNDTEVLERLNTGQTVYAAE